ncbi:RidA family protein [Empedobacter sedimenti]|uniref:RidA family protein n=1 Tax=Empedobacter sedimenti TaxID=3042610 RepID=UPI0024A7A23C|nr:RidA family protein [Empedobacter sedimenti]
MKIIQTENMPIANGHYSQCIEHNGILYLSGQLPIDRETKKIPSTISEQTELVLKNIETILHEANSDKNHVLQVRIYIPNIQLWDEVNAVYSDFFGTHKPTRCIIPTNELHYGALIEVEVTAITKS